MALEITAARPVCLSIAGWVPNGMAGLATDLKTFQALSVYGMGIPTCLTSQSVSRGGAIVPIEPEVFAAQLDTVLQDCADSFAGIKLGLLPTQDHVMILADWLSTQVPGMQIVLDPIRWSGVGQPLNDEVTYRLMLEYLVPLCRFVLPNAAEAIELNRLLGLGPETSFRGLSQAFPNVFFIEKGVLMHDATVMDRLWLTGEVVAETRMPQLQGYECRGTGCTHSSAFAAALARGATPDSALIVAQRYVWQCMKASIPIRDSGRRLLIHVPFTEEVSTCSR
jgi:hydroxymethylpyrimidine/phosphomethylpyrimidine kinase